MNSKQRRKVKRERKERRPGELIDLRWEHLPQSVRDAHVPYGGPETVAAIRKELDPMHEMLAMSMKRIAEASR